MKKIGDTGSFKNFYENNRIYIDKTEYLYRMLVDNPLERIFVSRPRRFGKSLTLDTVATLFESGVDPYFKGTWIYDKWTEPTYPVFRLNLIEYPKDDLIEFKRRLIKDISNFAFLNKIKNYFEDFSPTGSLKSLLEALAIEHRKIVLLIDEYDCQLTANINNKKIYDSFQEFLREFYGIIKGKYAIRFLGVTGVTRLKDVSIFSVGSDINDITNDSACSQMIGFTRDEIKKYYIDYLKLAASCENNCSVDKVTDAQIESMLDMMAQNYDGYCFDEFYKKKVFSTWSVNKFFQNIVKNKFVDFGEYWYDNGGLPSILVNYLKTHELNIFDYLDKNKSLKVTDDDFKNPTSLTTINQNVLMCQTGYLTLRSSLNDSNIIALGIPNGEIYKALNKLLAAKFFKGTIDVTNDANENILDVGSVEDIISLLNTMVNTVTYDAYPLNSESSVQNYVKAYLLGAKQNVFSEIHQAKGRADLVIETNKRRIVIEFKYAKDETEAKAKLSEAIEQIKTRDYGNIVPRKDELLRIAAVFNADPKVRAFTEFQLV
ncbi:MAG TPA: ATP-binding protein [Succinivibrionaceae bacterium]|nr:ATP-binding protein [Succinivibrionaceae bacterium]